MQIVVTKQIGIEADTIEEAVAKVANGEGVTMSISANARPQSQNTGIPTGGQFPKTAAQVLK